jgi:hypothetical protein
MEKAWLGVDAGIKNPTGLTCSTLPEHSAALSQGRKRRSRPLSLSSSMTLSFLPKRSSGLWISLEAAQRSCWHCYGSETRESSTRPRSQRGSGSRDTYRGESKTDARDAHVVAYPKRGDEVGSR